MALLYLLYSTVWYFTNATAGVAEPGRFQSALSPHSDSVLWLRLCLRAPGSGTLSGFCLRLCLRDLAPAPDPSPSTGVNVELQLFLYD